MSGDDRPIGLFDSGVGGLTVLAAVARALPHEPLLYLGDTARLPYGTKSPETVRRYAARAIDVLRERGVKMVVVACNTATALALDVVREHAGMPVIGVVEPGAREALESTRGRLGPIAVLATEATVASDAYGAALRRIDPRVEVLSQACPLFVPLAEEGWTANAVAEATARIYLEPVVGARPRAVVLGCTHYPLLADTIRKVLGPGPKVIDSADSVAREVVRMLEPARRSTFTEPPEVHVLVTDASERFRKVADRFLGRPVGRLELVDIP